jgi:hypothetical protein
MAFNPLVIPPPYAINNIIHNVPINDIVNNNIMNNNIVDNNIVDNNVNINDINNNILNYRPAYFLVGNEITFVENGVNRRVPFINPINWVNYVNMNNNNANIIRINYEYWVLHLFGERNYYNNMLIQMENNDVGRYIMGAHNMDRVTMILNRINDDIARLGNIYLGILLNNRQD